MWASLFSWLLWMLICSVWSINLYLPSAFLPGYPQFFRPSVSVLAFLTYSFIHSFVPSFFRSFVRSFLRSFVPAPLRSFVPSFLASFLPSFLPSFLRSFVRSFVCSFVRSFIRSFVHSFIHSFIHSLKYILFRDYQGLARGSQAFIATLLFDSSMSLCRRSH